MKYGSIWLVSWRVFSALILIMVSYLTLWFVEHSLSRPWLAVWDLDDARGWLFDQSNMAATLAVFAHMIPGAIITFAVPLQAISFVRLRWPAVHRWSGYFLAAAAGSTGVLGLIYIALQGTVGGAWMSFWFAVYGVSMVLASAMTVIRARQRNILAHRRWAGRLVILALASYIYRIHYGIWWEVTGTSGVEDGYSGPFDRFNVWGFFVPYLFAHEIVLAILAFIRRQI